MAVDKVKLDKFFESLEKEYGEGSVSDIDGMMKIKRWSTGLEGLDDILGGGMPCGRIIEIFGAESAGKTTLLYHLMSLHETAVFIPIEGTFDPDRAKAMGNRSGQLKIRRAFTAEQCLETANKAIEYGVSIVGIDSVPAMKIQKDFDEEDLEKDLQPARTAAFLSEKLPKTNFIAEKYGGTLIFINQLRDAMNKTFFMPDDHTPGGRALKFFSSIRMKVSRKSSITIPNKNPRDTAEKKEIGIIIKCKVVKSKIHNPKGECELYLIFDRGFVSFDEVELIRQEMMLAQRKSNKENVETKVSIETRLSDIKKATKKEVVEEVKKKKKKKGK